MQIVCCPKKPSKCAQLFCCRCPFAFQRSLFVKGPHIGDELSFEEFRASFYSVIPAEPATHPETFKTPLKAIPRSHEDSKNRAESESILVHGTSLLLSLSSVSSSRRIENAGCVVATAETPLNPCEGASTAPLLSARTSCNTPKFRFDGVCLLSFSICSKRRIAAIVSPSLSTGESRGSGSWPRSRCALQ